MYLVDGGTAISLLQYNMPKDKSGAWFNALIGCYDSL